MMKIILMRHGETLENKDMIAQGQLPGNLSEKGFLQAKKTGAKLPKEKIDIVYSSDLRRAKQTANEVIEFLPNIPLKFTKRIREKNFGDFQGKPYPKNWDTICWKKGVVKKHGGESYEEIMTRAKSFIESLKKKHDNETVLLVTHKRMIQTIIALNKNPTLKYLQVMKIPKNASLTRLKF